MYRRLDDFRAQFQEEVDDTLKVPAFYGPVLEDWAALGAPVPVV